MRFKIKYSLKRAMLKFGRGRGRGRWTHKYPPIISSPLQICQPLPSEMTFGKSLLKPAVGFRRNISSASCTSPHLQGAAIPEFQTRKGRATPSHLMKPLEMLDS